MRHRIGIIGCGWIAPFHVNALSKLRDRAEIAWVADSVPERARLLAAQVMAERLAPTGGHVRALTDYLDGFGDADSVLILLPHHLHHRATIDALESGLHVLLEKPLAVSLAEADDMIDAAARSRRLLMVAYPHRYRSTMRAFRELIHSGRYGRLFLLDGMMDENLRGYADLGWIREKRTLGGGVFFSSSPHMLDVMLWIGGPVRTMSMVGAHAGLAMEGEDTAASVIKFESGAIGATRHTWASPGPKIWYTMRAVCEKAVITLTTNPLGNLVTEGHRCAWQTAITASPPDAVLLESDEGLDFTGELNHFFDCLDTGQPCETDGCTARGIMALIFSAYEKAARDGGN